MQIEFRDGPREVLDHLAVHMKNMETFRMTYPEAVDAVNKKLQSDFISAAGDRVVTDHFARMRRGELG